MYQIIRFETKPYDINIHTGQSIYGYKGTRDKFLCRFINYLIITVKGNVLHCRLMSNPVERSFVTKLHWH